MTIDEKTYEAFRNVFIKINDDHIPVEEVIANELKNISYIKIFIQKIKKDILYLRFETKKEEKNSVYMSYL